MSSVRDVDAEQELIEGYVRRWQAKLFLGNWHIHSAVKEKKDWISDDEAYTLMEKQANVAYIYFLYSQDKEKEEHDSPQWWHNNLELIVIHELYHIVIFGHINNLTKKQQEREEELVNQLSIITYRLEYKLDPTKEEANGRSGRTSKEAWPSKEGPGLTKVARK